LFNVQGYTVAQVMEQVIAGCKDAVTRDCIIQQATSLDHLKLPMLLPGIDVHTDKSTVIAIRQMQMARFDGRSWVLMGDVLGDK
ncbi:MAG: branched-chain amino acid ABC transporter substrate-binding protein, partial [Tardiphaga sp.]